MSYTADQAIAGDGMLCYCSQCQENREFKRISLAVITGKYVTAKYECTECGHQNLYKFPK